MYLINYTVWCIYSEMLTTTTYKNPYIFIKASEVIANTSYLYDALKFIKHLLIGYTV